MQVSIIDNEKTMTTREIAELTGKDHRHILADTRTMLESLGIDCAGFAAQYKDASGKSNPMFVLPKRETLILVSGYSVAMRAKIIDRWQELETITAPKQKAIPATQVFTEFFQVACLIGLDKNAAAIGANQAANQLTGTNVLQLLGHTHLIAEKQNLIYTPTELGAQFLSGLSARKVNLLLAEAGLQTKEGEHWAPTPKADGLYRLLDTGKKSGSGTSVLQCKWFNDVIPLLKPYQD